MHRPMRIAAAAVAFLLCLSVCGCGILRKAPDKEPAAQQPVSDVQQEQNMPRLNESEQKGRDVAATIESMTECKVVKENEEKCVMKITAPDMQYVMRRAMEQLQDSFSRCPKSRYRTSPENQLQRDFVRRFIDQECM